MLQICLPADYLGETLLGCVYMSSIRSRVTIIREMTNV